MEVACLLAKRVARGAALLDRVMPLWHLKIDLDRLDMDSNSNCIIGQLYGAFNVAETEEDSGIFINGTGYEQLFRDKCPYHATQKVATHGFIVWEDSFTYEICTTIGLRIGRELKLNWIGEIQARRACQTTQSLTKLMARTVTTDASKPVLANAS